MNYFLIHKNVFSTFFFLGTSIPAWVQMNTKLIIYEQMPVSWKRCCTCAVQHCDKTAYTQPCTIGGTPGNCCGCAKTPVMCGGATECPLSFPANEEETCLWVKVDQDDTSDGDREATLTTLDGRTSVTIKNSVTGTYYFINLNRMCIFVHYHY